VIRNDDTEAISGTVRSTGACAALAHEFCEMSIVFGYYGQPVIDSDGKDRFIARIVGKTKVPKQTRARENPKQMFVRVI
jgi:hypothetical protein